MKHAKRGVNQKDANNGGNAFREEGKRNSIFEKITHAATIAASLQLSREVRLPDHLVASKDRDFRFTRVRLTSMMRFVRYCARKFA